MEEATDLGEWGIQWRFPVTMRDTPNITAYSTNTADNNAYNVGDAVVVSDGPGTRQIGTDGCGFRGVHANEVNDFITVHGAAEIEL
jgi:hypothetical protein